MKSKKMKFESVLILILSITILFVAVGFMYLSIKLDNCSKTKNRYEVKVVKVVKETVISGSSSNVKADYKILDKNKTVKFNLNLNDNKDFISYTVIIKNTGTLPAQIDNIIEKANYQNNLLTIKHSDVIGDVIEPGDEVELSISINSPQNDILSKDLEYQITILTSNIK